MWETLKELMRDEIEEEKRQAVQAAERAAQTAKQEAQAAKQEAQAAKQKAQTAARETEKNTIEKMLRKGKMSIEEIADYCTEFTIKEIREIEAELKLTV